MADPSDPDTGGAPKRVVRTGLALVHENEIIFPAAGDEAQATRAIDDAVGGAVHVYFPVEVEIRSAGDAAADPEEAARRLLAGVVQRLQNMA